MKTLLELPLFTVGEAGTSRCVLAGLHISLR